MEETGNERAAIRAGRTPAGARPATNDVLLPPHAMTEPGLPAPRHAVRRDRPPFPVTASYPEASGNCHSAGGAAVAAGTPNLDGGPAGHAVLFYRAAGELAGQAGAYLLEALRAGGTALVIATPAH